MATIQIILDAINNATRTFEEVAGSLETVRVAQDQAAESAMALSDAQLEAANAAVSAFSAYSELRASADELAVANVNAAAGAEQLATVTQRSADQAISAATSYSRLSDAQLNAAQTGMEAAAAARAEAEALDAVTRDAALASAGIRVLSDAELAAAGNATRTAFAFRALNAAQIAGINNNLAAAAAARVQAAAQGQAGIAAVAAGAAAGRGAGFWRQLGGAMAAAGAAGNAAGAGGVQAAAGANVAAAAALRAGRGFGLWGQAMGLLGVKIPLWGGLLNGLLPKMLTQVGGWHLLADAIIEVLAVWGPAIIAAGAWAAAASDAINDVIRHMTSLHTVSDAFGQSIPPMTSNLEKLHDAVRPQVYSIFGDALSVITKRGGELNQVIMQTGQVFQQLAARAALAINSTQMSEFLHNSVNDVRLLGAAFGNLFGIIGNLIRMNQGWAGILLQVGTAFLGLVEHVTALLIPLGQLLVFGHGFILWVGLAVTGAVKFGQTLAGWGTGIGNGAAAMVSLVRMIAIYISQVGLAAAASAAFAAVNPFVWVGVAAAALAGLVIWVSHAKDATTAWGAAMQEALKNAQSLSAGLSMLGADQTQVTQRLTAAKQQLNATSQPEIQGYADKYSAAQRLNSAYGQQAAKVTELTGIHKQLADQQETYNTRLNILARTYGGVANAEGLLIASGVTMKQMLDTSGAAWAMIQQMVEAAYRGYGAMAAQSGVLGNAMQVLDKQATDQYKAMQQLNQAWDTQTSAMTGTQGAFDTAAQGFDTLANANQKVTLSLGKLKEKFDYAKAGIDSLTPSGIALNQAFAAQVTNINSLADSWRSAGIDQGMFSQGIKDSIAQLVPYAKGSQEATAQLAGLAQEAGYDGPAAMKNLVQWLGNTAGGLQQVKDISNQATVQEALLTSAMQNQGNYIANQLIGDINQAILGYNHVRDAASAYGRAIAQSGRDSDAAHQARQRFIDDTLAAGRAMHSTTGEIAALITKVTGIPKSVALRIVMTGTGSYSIQGRLDTGQSVPGVTQGAPAGVAARGGATVPAAAAGMYVRGGAPNKDGVLIKAMHGEVVVPTHLVNAGAVDHLRGKIRGFAGGGQVGGSGRLTEQGNTGVLDGQYAVDMHAKFEQAMVASMVSAMRSAIKRGAAAAAAAAAGGGGGADGPAGGDPSVNAAMARSMFPQWASGALWQAWNYVAMRESGWNRFAKNPSSGAYGIPQALPESKLPPGGRAAGGSHAAPQIGWMGGYMTGRYGGPAGAAAHERAYNWYDQGGMLPPGPSLAMNATGQPELVLPPAVIQGFTGGLEQLHSPLILLIGAVHQQTQALRDQTAATAAAAQAALDAAAAGAKPKPKPAAKPATVQMDQKKIADDKANAARLEARIKAVQQAIKDTPAKDKAARKEEENLLKQLQAALKTQNKTTGKDEAALAKEIVKENKAVVAAMQKQIAAITKLLGSGSAATSKSNALWAQLVADEGKLAAAQKTLAGQVSGRSGGGTKVTGTVAVDKGTLAAMQAGEVRAFDAAVAKLKAQIAANPRSGAAKLAAGDLQTLLRRQAAEVAQYNKTVSDQTAKNFSHLMALLHDEVRTANDKGLNRLPGTAELTAALRAAATAEANLARSLTGKAPSGGKAGGGGGGGTTVSGSGGYAAGVVTDRKTESELSQLLAEARKENAELVKVVALLGSIKAEAEPAAQAKAIGPAVAQALNSASRGAAGSKSTRRG